MYSAQKQISTKVNSIKLILSNILILTLALISFAQIDLNYDPAVGYTNNFASGNVEIQPDGKIIVFGNFNNISGVSKNDVARLNADGTLDTTFNCSCNNFTGVNSVKVQTDGKIIIAGASGENQTFAQVARLNPDGSIDPTFSYATTPTAQTASATIWGIQSDGKLLISRHASSSGFSSTVLSRYNPDGSNDASFNQITLDHNGFREFLLDLKVMADDKIMIGGSHRSFGKLYRLMPDGLVDKGFESPVLTVAPMFRSLIRDFEFQSDGKIVVNGNFDSINGISRTNFARLNTDGSVDTSFSDVYTDYAYFEITSNDRIRIVRSGFNDMQGLNADGTFDSSFTPIEGVNNFVLDNSDRIIAAQSINISINNAQAIRRFNTWGEIDNTFNDAYFGTVGEVTAMAKQADGKILIGGRFSVVGGKVRAGIARINTDGTVDETFIAPEFNDTVNKFAIQGDGKILVGGSFTSFGGASRNALVRLNTDGSIDATFNPVIEYTGFNPNIAEVVIQTDGNILIGGRFHKVNGTDQTATARLNHDGSLDTNYNPTLSNAFIGSVAVQADGKIMLGGNFSGINGFNRTNLARLNTDSSLDTSFNAGSIPTVTQVLIRPNNQYLLNHSNSIALRNADGSVDNSYNAPTVSGVSQILPFDDGTIIIVGSFASVNGIPRNDIARINPNGSLDTVFLPGGVDGFINNILEQDDGKLVVGGEFESIENVDRSSLARFTPPIAQNIVDYDFDGDGKADIAVFRPSENKWYVLRSSDFGVTQQIFAIDGDIPTPADHDGDGKSDFAIYRESQGDWWSLSTASGSQVFAHLGQNGDIPRPSDFDGDGRADYVVFRPSNNTWYRVSSATGQVSNREFGAAGDKPIIGDFDGDGKSDVAIYRPSTGTWWWQSSVNNGQFATQWGISTDIPTPGDFDGDGITDFAIYRPSTGVWWIYNSATQDATIIQFGISEDKPVPADYDGDGKVDIAVFRPSTGIWYLLRSTEGFSALQFGISTDIPIPNALIP